MHSFQRALLVAFLALSLFQVNAYTPKARSGANALRFARGQPPMAPKRLFHPNINVARDSAPSATPSDPGSSEPSIPTPTPSASDVPVPPLSSSSSSSPLTSSASDSVSIDPSPSSSAQTPDPTPSTSASATPSIPADPIPSSSAPPVPTAPVPGTVQTGYFGIYSSSPSQPAEPDDANFVGYMGAYGITNVVDPSSAAAAWTYSYTVPTTPDTPVNVNHPNTPYRLTAVAIRSGPQVTLGPGNQYYLEVLNSRASTPAYSSTSTYVYDTYAIGYAQTAVWQVDPLTSMVTCRWVNPDGSRPQTFTVKSGTILYVTGDPDALRSQLGNPADFTTVTLYLQNNGN